MGEDIFIQRNPVHVRVRVERTLSFQSRRVMDEYTALGGSTLEELDIDPDTPAGKATGMILRGWARTGDGIRGWLAQWGMMENEVLVKEHVRVFVDGELAYEEER